MKCGVAVSMNNDADLGRFVAAVDEGDSSKAVLNGSDNEVWDNDVRLGDLVEPLGFDSIWAYEHHGTPYIQIPDPLQWLSWWAGRTQRIGVGTMLVIVPWHQPVRLAEQLVLLQHMLGDREMNIGLGRGLGLREYSALDLDMNESRDRFAEGVKVVQALIGQESVDYQGNLFRVPNTSQRAGGFSIRPRPRDAQRLLDSLYGGWISPTSVTTIAGMDLKPIVIPNKQFSDYVDDLRRFSQVRAEAGLTHVRPIVATYVGHCGETDAECDEVFQQFLTSAMDPENGTGGHTSIETVYEFAKNYHANVPGYEFYGEKLKELAEIGHDIPARTSEAITIGTPEDHIKSLTELVTMLGAEQLVVGFRDPGRFQSFEMAEKSMRLFAKEVLPAIHEIEVSELPEIR